MPSISLPLHSYGLRAAQASTSRLLNCHIEQLPPDAKTPAVLVRSPGLASWGTVGTGPIEGTHTDHGLLYVVSGGGFYSVTSGAVATLRGAVGSSTEIDMESNTASVVIVSPPLAYHWTPSTFAQITDSDFTSRGAGDVEFQGGRFLFREPSTGRFFGSDVNSATAYDALSFATAESSSDALVGLKVDHEEVFLAGEKTCEFWFNNGGSGFPYERMSNGVLELGCVNGKTIAKLDNSIFWVASDYSVRRLDGFTPVRVSTHAVEQWLRTVTLASLRGYSFTLEGHLFYMLRATEGAFFFDVTTQFWHERGTYGQPSWNWSNPIAFAGKVLVGSTTSNVIAELSPTTFADIGDTQRMEWVYQPFYAEGKRIFHDKIELTLDVGVGLTSGQGSAPEVMLDISDDAGRTWQALPNRSIGALGKYATKVTWHGLGSAYQRVYRFAISDPVKVAVTDAVLTYRAGR
jgi:hypothetical protein